MAVTTKQIARYRIIDECLQNRHHQPSTSNNSRHRGIWSLNDLMEAIEQKTDSTVSDRTLKEDISRMKEDIDLAYYAPIENERGIGYFYSDPGYKLTETPLSPATITALKDVIELLRQFKGFKYFENAEGLIYNIEENILKSEFTDVQFDVLPGYNGLDFIDPIKKAIREKKVLKMTYKAFYEEAETPRHIHPYLLKEYNNRWFVYAYTNEYANTDRDEGVYGLGRIISLDPTNKRYRHPSKKRIKEYFRDIIGVTNYKEKKAGQIVLRLTKERANYLLTKPIHYSQKTIKQSNEFVWFSFKLKSNPELIALILSYGKDIVVESPKTLVVEISGILNDAIKNYS